MTIRIVMGPWPTTREIAKKLGAIDYFTGIACASGHVSIRRTNSGKCYECLRLCWERVRRRKGKLPFKPNNEKRAAEKLGEKYFKGNPCPHGHNGLRWTHNGACVECSVSAAREFHRRDEGLIYLQKWRAENADKVREYNRNTKARRKGADGRHTESDVNRIIKRQKYKCAECGASVRKRSVRHVDHIMPLARGGTNWPSNLQILCKSCNVQKHAKDPIDFARSKGRLL